MSQLSQITLGHTYNYGVYNDTDAMTDYFNYTGEISLKKLIERIKERGADTIIVDVVNHDASIPVFQRLNRIEKNCRYRVRNLCGMKINQFTGKEFMAMKFELVKY